MGGWSVTIMRQPVEDYPHINREKVLADWTVGSSGTRWINALVSRGEAKRVRDGGYPNLYTAPACVIAPLLATDEPPSGETGIFAPREVRIMRTELDACPPDELLTIMVWDQS